jgi:hypothetical protein
MATDHGKTENHAEEEKTENRKEITSEKELSSVILPWLMAVLAAGLFFSPPGTATSIKLVTLIIMGTAVVVAAIKAKRALGLNGTRATSILLLPAVPVALLGTALGWQFGRNLGTEATSNQKPTVTASSFLHFSDRSYIDVPYCRSYYGTGTIPQGDSLLIFDSPANGDWDLKQPVRYTFHGLADPQPNGGWVISNVKILGPSNAGAHAVLFGVLETNQDAQFVQQIAIYSKSSGSYWRSGSLPLGLGRIKLPVEINDTAEC